MSKLFIDHSRHRLKVSDLEAPLDVLVFEGQHRLSQPYEYRIEFTSSELDLKVEQLLGQGAEFSLYPEPVGYSRLDRYNPPPPVQPLRTVYGVITEFQRLSASRDEARYCVVLKPRLALLERTRHYAVYQQRSVPQIVEQILRERHRFEGFQFHFKLTREYPPREQVIQFGESDLAFIQRLLAEVGIWYHFSMHAKVPMEVIELRDDQRHYLALLRLPVIPPAGMPGNDDRVWNLAARHRLVQRDISVRSYNPQATLSHMEGRVEPRHDAIPTYGEAYHYGEAYREIGSAFLHDEDLPSESGYFYARLRHELYLNDQTRLSGDCSSATLMPGQLLKVTGELPQAFADRIVITALTCKAARDSGLRMTFEAIPYAERVCFRPPLPAKPCIAGTVPARVTSTDSHDRYADIDGQGRYKVNFLFDRQPWPEGQASAWLRLARAYAGDTHGLHLPLIHGTEVAVAFEQGDPDRPYIAHALHDDERPDLVTQKNYKRNVLRTPANNKLRMEDERGREHVKLASEHSGKSQLNLGHVVDGSKQPRGAGFELRSDGHGAIRGGKGVFISAEAQAGAAGDMLAMAPASRQLEAASEQLDEARGIARHHHSPEPASSGLEQLRSATNALQQPAILLSAPAGIAAVTPGGLLLGSQQAMYLTSADELSLLAAQRLTAQANHGISLLARQDGLRLVSGKGPLQLESHGDGLGLVAQQDVTLQSVQGHVQVTAKNGITLGCGGGSIRITANGEIELRSPSFIDLRGRHRLLPPASEAFELTELPGWACVECLRKGHADSVPLLPAELQE